MNMYNHFAQSQGAVFYPLIMETFGAIGSRGLDFISRLAEEASANGVCSLENQRTKQFVLRSLSLTLQRSNSTLMINGCRLAREKAHKVS